MPTFFPRHFSTCRTNVDLRSLNTRQMGQITIMKPEPRLGNTPSKPQVSLCTQAFLVRTGPSERMHCICKRRSSLRLYGLGSTALLGWGVLLGSLRVSESTGSRDSILVQITTVRLLAHGICDVLVDPVDIISIRTLPSPSGCTHLRFVEVFP